MLSARRAERKSMKYIKDVDTGEIFPIENETEQEIEIPAFVKNDFPEIKVNYNGENNANDIILDLSHQLKEEKNSKTVYHKFPIIKILCAVIVTTAVIVVGIFCAHFAKSIKFEPITIEYTENSAKENEPEQQEENTENEEINENNTLISEITSIVPKMLMISLTVVGVRIAIKFMTISIRGE